MHQGEAGEQRPTQQVMQGESPPQFTDGKLTGRGSAEGRGPAIQERHCGQHGCVDQWWVGVHRRGVHSSHPHPRLPHHCKPLSISKGVRRVQRTDSLEKTLMLGKIEGGGEGDDRGRDGGMASRTQQT